MSFISKYQKKVEEEEKELEELIAQGNPEQEAKPEDEGPEPTDPEEITFKKRYGDLRRHSQKKEKELTERIEALEKSLEAKPQEQAPTEVPSNMKEMMEWKEKYPSVARIIETMIQEEADKKLKEAKVSIEEIQFERQQSKKDKALKEITKAHPDFEDLQYSEEFQDWAEEQPRWIQTALFEQDEDAQSVIKVLNLFKMEQGEKLKPLKEKEDKKKAAGFIDTKGQRTSVDSEEAGNKIKESWVNKLSMKDYEKNEEKIMEAMRTGNFIYDLSGGAR
jgi:hypothetical protein